MSQEYDYIVVGGGTAGLVVAARLSENPDVKVLVIEAGGDRTKDPRVVTPGLVSQLYGKKEFDWGFQSPPQPSLHGRRIQQPRGRMLGGTSAMNFFMTVYPSRAVLDAWGELVEGQDGWSFDDFAPYFRKFAKTSDPAQDTLETVEKHLREHYDESITKEETGPLPLSFGEYSDNNAAWLETFAKLGLKATADPRSGTTFGAFQQTNSIDPVTHTRTYSASAYLTDEVRARPNLDVVTDSIVAKVVLEGDDNNDNKATGVVVQTTSGENRRTISVRREVILAAGALQSPQILELSGIGDRALLEKYDIPVLVDNPNVGEHLQDHPIVCQSVEVNEGVPSADLLRDPAIQQAVIAQYQQQGGKGPLGQNPISCAYAPLVDSNGILPVEKRKALIDDHLDESKLERPLEAKTFDLVRHRIFEQETQPSLQYVLFPGQVTIRPAELDKSVSAADVLPPSRPENYLTVMVMLSHPLSRGTCHIVSGDVQDKPIWDPRYNDADLDLALLASGVQFLETLLHTEPFSAVFKKDGRRAPDLAATSVENAREIVRQGQISVFHVSGSCAMAPRDLGGVVDSKLRVYGVKGLRVVDASIFPIEPMGNIQSTVYAVAEKAADLIKADQ